MSFWHLQRVAAALGQSADNLESSHAEVAGITTDSRAITPGQVFVALIGETFDGHDYVAGAVQQGAAAVIVSRPPASFDINVPVFEVNDTLVALGRLGSYYRREWGRKIVAVAGSNGKTTTKDLIRAALSKSMNVHATTGNLNNRIGVPLTLLAIPRDAEIAVVEIGTNIPGEVAILREIVRPEVAVVTSVAEEHLEGLGDLDGVLREEAAIYDGVEVGIAPASQPEIGEAARGKAKRVVTAGLEDGDVVPASWTIDADGRGTIGLGDVVVAPPLRGLHNLQNTILAVAVARELGVADADVAAGISSMEPPRMRVAWEAIGKATLINDAYNANPGSTRAAIDLVKGMSADRQRVIVLGTMRELGDASSRCHLDIARLAISSGADVIAGVGEFAPALDSVSDGEATVVTAESVEELWPKLEPRMERDAVILLKASRGVRLERLVPQLTTWATS